MAQTKRNNSRNQQVPTPANDNYPSKRRDTIRPLVPANDNVVRKSTVTLMRKEVMKMGLRVHPLLRVGMNVYDLYRFLRELQNQIRGLGSVARGKQGSFAQDHTCGRPPAFGPFRAALYTACGPLTSPYQGAQSSSPYMMTTSRLVTLPGYFGLSRIWGPVSTATRLTAPRTNLNPREALNIADLPVPVQRLVKPYFKPNNNPLADPVRAPEPYPALQPARQPNMSGRLYIAPGSSLRTSSRAQSPAAFPVSRPPKGPEKKYRSTSPAVLAGIFKALDHVSELAEKVDCLHNALPKGMQASPPKASIRSNRRFVDSAGQYGIDGADWKMPAIIQNIQHVNWGKALHCIGLNEIEDKLIGKIHAGVGRLYKGPSDVITEGAGKIISSVLDPEKGVLKWKS